MHEISRGIVRFLINRMTEEKERALCLSSKVLRWNSTIFDVLASINLLICLVQTMGIDYSHS